MASWGWSDQISEPLKLEAPIPFEGENKPTQKQKIMHNKSNMTPIFQKINTNSEESQYKLVSVEEMFMWPNAPPIRCSQTQS